jgi:sulfate adenylyltransferase
VEVFVDTPLEVCAERDVKGLYAGAERGEVAALTGVADPYEPPLSPELRLETVGVAVTDNGRQVIDLLVERGFLDAAVPPR